MEWVPFLQAILNGVATAAVYAPIALGFVIIYKSMQVLSFAQPGLVLIGAWWVVLATDAPRNGVPGVFWVVLAIALVGGVAAVVGRSRGFVSPLVARLLMWAMAGVALADILWVGFFRRVEQINPVTGEAQLDPVTGEVLKGSPDIGGLGWPFWAAVLLGVVLSALVGLAVERGFLRPMVGKPVFAVAIMTIGIDLILRITALDWMGPNIRSVGDPWGIDLFTFGDFILAHRQLAAIVATTVVVAGLVAFFRYTRMGLAMRATAFDQEVALTQGVSVTAVFALSWAIAAVLAMMGGVFLGSGFGLDRTAGIQALKALPVVVVGGLDSVAGAIVGALMIGVAEQLTVTYQPTHLPWLGTGFAQVVPYLVMFLVLLVRPYGLFGTKEVERV